MSRIVIDIPEEYKEHFLDWLSNSGEQEFYEHVAMLTDGVKCSNIEYPFWKNPGSPVDVEVQIFDREI